MTGRAAGTAPRHPSPSRRVVQRPASPIPDGVICGTRMREHSRTSEGIKWCFHCRRRCEMWRVVAVPDGESYYGPTVHIECGGCRAVDVDLFPGRIREWDEQ